jgi:hypothetical protein
MSFDAIVPSFDRLRLATMEDLPRIAIVAAAGFFHSPTFQYQRSHYAEYPDDTLFSYWREYAESILDPHRVVLVAEDKLVDTEDNQVYDALRRAAAYMPTAGMRGGAVVVGVASVRQVSAYPISPSGCMHAQLLQLAVLKSRSCV